MQTSKEHIELLWNRYLYNEATQSELDELFHYVQEAAEDAADWDFVKEGITNERLGQPGFVDMDTDRKMLLVQNVLAGRRLSDHNGLENLPERTMNLKNGDARTEDLKSAAGDLPAQNVRRVHFLKTAWFRYVAVFILFVGTGVSLWFLLNSRLQTPGSDQKYSSTEISPGREGAILTLSDGAQVVLDSLGNGVIAYQNGSKVVLQNGRLGYEAKKSAGGDGRIYETGAISYNTVTTPKGRQFRLVLPDGSKVWLNAASSIRYPTAFNADHRSVAITGEVYFDISADKSKPFTVSAQDIKIKVLGTMFNVNAYENEKGIKTTLAEGSVQILAGENTPLSQDVLLQPGQQARWAAGDNNQPDRKRLSIIPSVEIDNVIAWKNGLFDFNGVDLEELMRQIERWYDIEVLYENGIPDKEFVGKINRSSSLQTLLKAFESANIHFRTEGRKIVVLNDAK